MPLDTSDYKVPDMSPLEQSNLSANLPSLDEHSITRPNEQDTRIAMMPGNSQGEGEWICGSDLMQLESSENRPRLLPQEVKMMVFIENESEKAADCPACSNSHPTRNNIQTELWPRKGLYSMKVFEKGVTTKPKLISKIHPKKRFLKRFIQDQDRA
ncbi:uncharacterized protein ACMZJ9_010767 isoform 2-T2 [Mantella aurantiaca]